MKQILTVIATCAVVFGAQAQESMLINPDAKSMGMGGVVMTTLSSSHDIYTNAASPIFSRKQLQFSGTYFSQSDYNYYVASGYYNIDGNNVVQAGWRQFRREAKNNEMTLDVGYARRVNEHWSLGLVARYSHLRDHDQKADALSVDLSAMYVLPFENWEHYTTLRAGAKLGNVGGYLNNSNYELPMDLTAGVALDSFLSDAHQVALGVDAGYYFNPHNIRGFQASIGAEYNLMQLVQLRAGYHVGEDKAFYPNYASVGAGVRFMHLRVDFAYLFAKKNTFLRNTYSLSFGFDF
ncbi:MAG: PorV/PorQ family protein [Alistipes sp.]